MQEISTTSRHLCRYLPQLQHTQIPKCTHVHTLRIRSTAIRKDPKFLLGVHLTITLPFSKPYNKMA